MIGLNWTPGWSNISTATGVPLNAKGVLKWDDRECPDSSTGMASGTSTSASEAAAFAKALAKATSRKAQEYLTRRLEEARQASVFGVRPTRSFRQAATKYLQENRDKRSIGDDAMHLRQLDPYIGSLPLASVHMGTLRPFIEARRREGVQVEDDQSGARGGAAHPEPGSFRVAGRAQPHVARLRPEDQAAEGRRMRGSPIRCRGTSRRDLFQELPAHLARMALFKVNTGCRDQEVCGLRWEWEVAVPELDTSGLLDPRQPR